MEQQQLWIYICISLFFVFLYVWCFHHHHPSPCTHTQTQGPIRERLIIAYFRLYTRDGDITRIDHICKLCKSTGIHPPSTMTSSSTSSTSTKNNGFLINSDNNWSYKYPMEEEKLFHRFPLPSDLIRNVIGCLISDDIYSQSSIFPNIDHRSTRLSRQASMLYVILFFSNHVYYVTNMPTCVKLWINTFMIIG